MEKSPYLIAVDAVGIRMGGGAVLLEQLLAGLPAFLPEAKWHVFGLPQDQRCWPAQKLSSQIVLEAVAGVSSPLQRLHWINYRLPQRVRDMGTDILLAFANLAPASAPVPQVVYCHQPNAFLDEGTRHARLSLRVRLRALRWLILRGALASRRVIVQTATLRKRMEDLAPALKGRIHTIPAACRPPSPLDVPSVQARRAIYGAPRPRILYVAHAGVHKNHERLIAALPLIRRTYPHARLLLTVGKEKTLHAENSRMVEAVLAAARNSQVANQIEWLGCLSPADVNFAMQNSDVMAFPSLAESFGLPLAEAMIQGCPVAAADLPYAHDVAGPAAAYFDPWDPQSIASTLVSILRDSRRREALVTAGRQRAPLFSGIHVCAQIAAVLRNSASCRLAA